MIQTCRQHCARMSAQDNIDLSIKCRMRESRQVTDTILVHANKNTPMTTTFAVRTKLNDDDRAPTVFFGELNVIVGWVKANTK